MGAQKVILAELNKEFGGSAEAFGATTAGKVAKLQNEFGNVTEELMVGALPAINQVTSALSGMLAQFSAMSPEQQKMVGIGVAVAAAFGPFLIIAGKMAQGVSAMIKTVNSWATHGWAPASKPLLQAPRPLPFGLLLRLRLLQWLLLKVPVLLQYGPPLRLK